jgi:hypothetical protein
MAGTMGSIRVGFFEEFKGADTLLIDVDAEGLRGLIAWLRDVISSGRRVLLSDCPGVSFKPGLQVEALTGRDDTGLLKTGQRAFVWRRSEEGWTDIVEKLGAMGAGAGHQYLDGPRDDVQVMASFGEYGDEWWNRHGN